MALLLINAIKGGVSAHRDFNSPTPPMPQLNRRGRPRRQGPVNKGAYWLVYQIERKATGRKAAWKQVQVKDVTLEDGTNEPMLYEDEERTESALLSDSDKAVEPRLLASTHGNVFDQLPVYDDPPAYYEAALGQTAGNPKVEASDETLVSNEVTDRIVNMAEYDLTQKIIPHLDRHLAIPLLNHLTDIAIFPADQIARAQYDLVKGTNLVDYIESSYVQAKEAGSSLQPQDFQKMRDEATQKYQRLNEDAQPVLKVIDDPEAVEKLKKGNDKEKNLDLLRTEYNVTVDQINALYHFGHYQFTLGQYEPAAVYLYHFLIFSPSYDLNVSAHWGKLASNILTGEWEAALVEVKDLRDAIDNPHSLESSKPMAQLQARTWLLHWSLFVFFNLGENQGCQGLLDMFLSPAYLNTIQTSCPHLLRYLVAAAIISRRAPKPAGTRNNRDHVRDLTKIVQMEEYQYSDPVTGFLKDLFCDFDFKKAQNRLKIAESVVRADFFLSGFTDDFVENARWLVSEVFCRIHQRIDISDLSKTLNLSNEEGEKWIVNLIRDSRMGVEAKIDLKSNMLHITRPHTTPTATLIETTRGLAFRSQAIQFAMHSGGGGETQRGGRGGGRGGRGGKQGGDRPVPAQETEVAA